jgi:hypothetical protein
MRKRLSGKDVELVVVIGAGQHRRPLAAAVDDQYGAVGVR